MIPEILQQMIVEKAARYAAFSFSTDTFTVPMIDGTKIYAYALDIQLNLYSDLHGNGYNRLGANINADSNRINRSWNIPGQINAEEQWSQLPAFYCWEFLIAAENQGIAVNVGAITNGIFIPGTAQPPELPRPIGYATLPNAIRQEDLDPLLNLRSYFSNRNRVRVNTQDMNNLDFLEPINVASVGRVPNPAPFVATLHCVISNR
jgi:hypothetical protein